MRWVVLAIGLAACSFSAPPALIDGASDTPRDMPVDMDTSGRVTMDLIALWTFDDAASPALDTAGAGTPVALPVIAGAPTFSGGTLVVDAAARLASDLQPHLNADCKNAMAATLEAWVAPQSAMQGTGPEPVLVAGLSASINSRNISLLQAGDKWLGRARTTADVNGKPDLLSMMPVAATMTHVVLVVDAGTRKLYVNSVKAAEDAPGPPLSWDSSYRMMLANEFSQTRPWLGTFALVAMYKRALTEPEIKRNFDAGP